MKELVGAFNQEKAQVGAFSVIVKTIDRLQLFTLFYLPQMMSGDAAVVVASLVGDAEDMLAENQQWNTTKMVQKDILTHCFSLQFHPIQVSSAVLTRPPG